MEWVGPLRNLVWKNAGFGKLRDIVPYIEDYEPRYEPTVLPLASESQDDDVSATETEVQQELSAVSAQYYSVADYQRMYTTGELTPIAVARALLPLIRRDTSPPGEHSMAWFDTRVEQVLKAAEESTLRYKEKRPLGPLDGVPTAVKDEYDIDGYSTCLGSRNDYTGEVKGDDDDGTITSWCVTKLEEAGAIILGKLSMHEFGLGQCLCQASSWGERFRDWSWVGMR
jgi:hypothetical protein